MSRSDQIGGPDSHALLLRGLNPVVEPLVVQKRSRKSIDGRRASPIANQPFPPMTQGQADVYWAMFNGSNRHVQTAPKLAKKVGKSDAQVRRLLTKLQETGRVRRAGKMWYPTISALVPYNNLYRKVERKCL